jgi:hypothetical protein
VEVDQVADTVGEEYAAVRSKLLSLPSKAAPAVVGMTLPEAVEVLSDLVGEALEELSAA